MSLCHSGTFLYRIMNIERGGLKLLLGPEIDLHLITLEPFVPCDLRPRDLYEGYSKSIRRTSP